MVQPEPLRVYHPTPQPAALPPATVMYNAREMPTAILLSIECPPLLRVGNIY